MECSGDDFNILMQYVIFGAILNFNAFWNFISAHFYWISREYGGAPIFLNKIWIKINFSILCFNLFYPIYFIFLNNIGFQSISFKGNKRWVNCKVSTMMKGRTFT
jgi:hypothetical protein